ncbi:MAG: alpha/beta fold hydrolase [Hyphomonas sp.]|uniref:alpha/beta hydrolase family protein n=1 Tax=Hyphomonas sp. TaxID=87 RepID=UPI0034A08517
MKHAAIAALGSALLAACTSVPGSTVSRFADPAIFDEAFPPGLAEVFFDSDGDRLNGHIYLANGAGPHPTVILLHGFPGNEKNLDLAQALRRGGFNVLFFHYRGAWGSEGTYSFTHVIEDVDAAAGFLRANAAAYRVDPAKLITIGHSMGGFASLQGAARDPAIVCAAAIAPANMGSRAAAFDADPEQLAGFIAYSGSLQMLAGFSGEAAVAEVRANRADFELTSLTPGLAGKRVLIIGGDKDATIALDLVINPLIAAYKADPAIETTGVILSGDHSFSWSREALINTVADWAAGCR